METKPNSVNQQKSGTTRKIVTALVVIVVLAALALAAQYLVSQVNIVELLKKMHGG
jgi:hypothetical protein